LNSNAFKNSQIKEIENEDDSDSSVSRENNKIDLIKLSFEPSSEDINLIQTKEVEEKTKNDEDLKAPENNSNSPK